MNQRVPSPALAAGPSATFQHADVHRVVGLLWDTEHHFQAIFELPFALLAAGQQFLRSNAEHLWTNCDQHAGFISHGLLCWQSQENAELQQNLPWMLPAVQKNGNDYRTRQNRVLPGVTVHWEDFWGLMPLLQSLVSPAVPAGLQDPCLMRQCWQHAVSRAGRSIQKRPEEEIEEVTMKGSFSLAINSWFIQCSTTRLW